VDDRLLDCVEIEPEQTAEASVIWLHGLGADGHDFEPVVPALQLDLPVRYVFPHAPVRPVTLNGGYPMRAWFDLVSIDPGGVRDVTGIQAAQAAVTALIEREVARGIAADKIVVAGFSQGGAVAIITALNHPQRLAGLIALSTFTPTQGTFQGSEANAGLPVFMAHGEQDPVVAPALGEATAGMLKESGYALEWHSYAMPHAVCPAEIEDIRAFLARIL
jgi:phospholipase/carboxylesterase